MKSRDLFIVLLGIIFALIIGFSFGVGVERRGNTKSDENDSRKELKQRKKCLSYCNDYVAKFDNYCLHRAGIIDFSGSYYITEPEGYLDVKEYCPEMYEEYIAPIKEVWDSLRMLHVDRYSYKEQKIKVKKSDNVIITTGKDD